MPKKFKPVVNDTTVYVQGRLSYANLLEPRAAQGSDEKYYSCVVLIDKEDKESLGALKKGIEAAASKGVATKWGGKRPRKLETPIHDGDEKEGEEFHGNFYFNCKSRRPVAVLNRKKAPILDQNEVYSGMWGVVCVNFYPYANSGNNGVGAGLNAVLKTADDEAFSASGDGSRAFDSIEIASEEEEDDDLMDI